MRKLAKGEKGVKHRSGASDSKTVNSGGKENLNRYEVEGILENRVKQRSGAYDSRIIKWDKLKKVDAFSQIHSRVTGISLNGKTPAYFAALLFMFFILVFKASPTAAATEVTRCRRSNLCPVINVINVKKPNISELFIKSCIIFPIVCGVFAIVRLVMRHVSNTCYEIAPFLFFFAEMTAASSFIIGVHYYDDWRDVVLLVVNNFLMILTLSCSVVMRYGNAEEANTMTTEALAVLYIRAFFFGLASLIAIGLRYPPFPLP
uniref:Uncharacterized protein n=1 Tax=Ditylenchus dipsaci TaxID=166011 RepID=A0A915CTE0_9BILA